jgi:hypothetical protein
MSRVKCPGCGAVEEVEGPLRGQAVECRACGREFPAVRRKRRKARAGPLREGWRYFTGAIPPFAWGLAGLVVLWLGGVALALAWPDGARLLMILGAVLALVGNLWIAFIAYGDSQVFGMLCFGTCLFSYVYVFMSPYETWRPAALTVVGFLFSFSGMLVSPSAGAG